MRIYKTFAFVYAVIYLRFKQHRRLVRAKEPSADDLNEPAHEPHYLTSAHFNRLFSFLSPEEVRETLSAEEAKKLEGEGVAFRDNGTDASLREAEEMLYAEVLTLNKLIYSERIFYANTAYLALFTFSFFLNFQT